jgi:hypothetical protein
MDEKATAAVVLLPTATAVMTTVVEQPAKELVVKPKTCDVGAASGVRSGGAASAAAPLSVLPPPPVASQPLLPANENVPETESCAIAVSQSPVRLPNDHNSANSTEKDRWTLTVDPLPVPPPPPPVAPYDSAVVVAATATTTTVKDNAVVTSQQHVEETATSVAAAANEQVDTAAADTAADDAVAVVITVHSTAITVTVHRSGAAKIDVADTAATQETTETVAVSCNQTSPLSVVTRKRKVNGTVESSLLTATRTAKADEEQQQPPRKRPYYQSNKHVAASPPPPLSHSERLAVDVTGRVDRPGNALYRQKLAFYQPCFAQNSNSSSNEAERNEVLDMFLDCFVLQKAVPPNNDWLVLGPASARQALLDALMTTAAADRTASLTNSSSTTTRTRSSSHEPASTAVLHSTSMPLLYSSSNSTKLPVVYCGNNPSLRTQPGNVTYLDTIRSHQKAYFAKSASPDQRQAIVTDIAAQFEFVQLGQGNGSSRGGGRRWLVATPEWVINKVQTAFVNIKQHPPTKVGPSSSSAAAYKPVVSLSLSQKPAPPTTTTAAAVSSGPRSAAVKRTTASPKRVTVATNKPIVYCGGVEAGYGEPGNVAYLECIRTQYKKFQVMSDNDKRHALAASIADRFTFVRPVGRQWEPASEKWAVNKVRLALLKKAERNAVATTKSATTAVLPVETKSKAPTPPKPVVKPNGGVFAVAKDESAEEANRQSRSESTSAAPKVDWDEVIVLN